MNFPMRSLFVVPALVGAMLPAPGASAVPEAGDAVIITMISVGGFIGGENVDFHQVPLHSAVADGRHFTRVVAPSISGDRPMLVPVRVETLAAADLKKLDRLARAAGLAHAKTDFGIPNTADVPDLLVLYRGQATKIRSYGIGEEVLPKAQRARRAKVEALLTFLTARPMKTMGTVFRSHGQRYRVIAKPWIPGDRTCT